MESLEVMCEELEQICIQNLVSAKTLTLEVKSEKFKSKQKQFTNAQSSMSDKKAFKTLATTLLHQLHPLEPCRQVTLSL